MLTAERVVERTRTLQRKDLSSVPASAIYIRSYMPESFNFPICNMGIKISTTQGFEDD